MMKSRLTWLTRMIVASAIAMATTALEACRTLRPYEKEHLLKPSMDDARIGSLEPAYAKSTAAQFEKLAAGTAQGGGGSSCPTCGI